MDVTRQIRWIPDFGLDRELDWLRNMHDWMISKKRYWGLALPIWVCDACRTFEVVGGGRAARSARSAGVEHLRGPLAAPPVGRRGQARLLRLRRGHQPHRPTSAIPWLDAGIVPFSTLHYRTDSDDWQRWFPGDFITESFPGSVPQLVLLAAGDEHGPRERRRRFKTVLGHGTVRGEDGQPDAQERWATSSTSTRPPSARAPTSCAGSSSCRTRRPTGLTSAGMARTEAKRRLLHAVEQLQLLRHLRRDRTVAPRPRRRATGRAHASSIAGCCRGCNT